MAPGCPSLAPHFHLFLSLFSSAVRRACGLHLTGCSKGSWEALSLCEGKS